MLKNTLTTYGSVAKFFHWLIFLLIAGMVVYGYFLDDIPKAYAGMAYNIHKLMGLLILVLMLARALWASLNVKPMLPPDTPEWQRWIERGVHYAIYILVITMPLSGWIGSSASGRPPHLGDWQLQLPVPADEALAQASFDMHDTVILILIGLLLLHIAAGLYHHFIKRDNILRRMLP